MVATFGLLFLVLKMQNTVVIHIANFALVLLGSVLFLVFRGGTRRSPDIAFFILIGFSANVVFQVALFHEIDLSESLAKIDLRHWERKYMHFCSALSSQARTSASSSSTSTRKAFWNSWKRSSLHSRFDI